MICVLVCQRCHVRRRCRESEDDNGWVYRCSKGHTWHVAFGPYGKLNRIMRDIYMEWLVDYINSPSISYQILRKNV